MQQAKLGVCYYPEHWPETEWEIHAKKMCELGISQVRIAEFAWSRLEPSRGNFQWAWLDRAIATLANHSLKVILCTPTACPPKWLMDEYPEIYADDGNGVRREFGSRRHYCFSNARYRKESKRITECLAKRYAKNPAICGWQTDNEYGCHDTTLSYSASAKLEFQRWLSDKYQDIGQLNEAWGTVFWSQEYVDFATIEMPLNTVTEANPSHRLDFQRFSSAQVKAFNDEQVQVLRHAGVTEFICHNFMGNFIDFDHYDVADSLDIAAWDSYPLGFLDQAWFSDTEKNRYRRTGHPDWAAFQHDLYYGVGKGRFAVMEQQPGPVNWADFNAQPISGMVRVWAWEAIAHGAEFVSFFRFKQAPFAQEQMHAGLLCADGQPAQAWAEVEQLSKELQSIDLPPRKQAKVALVFDYVSQWMNEIQPQAKSFNALEICFSWYSALRRLGIDVDIISSSTQNLNYSLIVIPSSISLDEPGYENILNSQSQLIIGPRCGSKTSALQIPNNLAPGKLQSLLPIKIRSVDSIRNGSTIFVSDQNTEFSISRWLEDIESDLTPLYRTRDGMGVVYQNEKTTYINAWIDDEMLSHIFQSSCQKLNILGNETNSDVRLTCRGKLVFAINYGPESAIYKPDNADCLLGSEYLKAADIAIWKILDE